MHAYGTYKILDRDTAYIEVTYPDGTWGMERVTRPRHGSLYDAAYAAASVKATIQGARLERFSEEA